MTDPSTDPFSTLTLEVASDFRLRDLALIQARIRSDVIPGVQRIRLCGAVSMTEGARLALMAIHDRMQREGIELVLESG